jgi:alkyl sulfatase BDS1-like metallo-beta-lactamase superfamily hydrolase
MSIKEKICVKILMNIMNYASAEITKFDNEFKSKLKGLEETILWKVGDDISYYTEIKNDTIKGEEGKSDNPTLTFEISDVETALNLFTGKIDIADSMDKIKIVGNAEKVQKLNFILDTVKFS